MPLFSQSFLEGLETALINAHSEEHAKVLLARYTLPELKSIQKYLNAYKKSAKTKETIINAIVSSTFTSVRQSKIIRNTD